MLRITTVPGGARSGYQRFVIDDCDRTVNHGGMPCAHGSRGARRPLLIELQVLNSESPPVRGWSGRRDSNPRPFAWEANALPAELLPHGADLTRSDFVSAAPVLHR